MKILISRKNRKVIHSYGVLDVKLKMVVVFCKVTNSDSKTVILGAVLSVDGHGSSGSKVHGNGIFIFFN